jgi:ABC-2 type transport system permease protein
MTVDLDGTGDRPIGGGPARSVDRGEPARAGALLLRDLVVLRKHLGEFVLRTLVQPFLLCFVFLYVFPKIGQGIGGRRPRDGVRVRHRPRAGVVGISIMFQGVQSVALRWPRSSASPARSRTGCRRRARSGWSRSAKVLSGAVQGMHLGDHRAADRLGGARPGRRGAHLTCTGW